MPSPKKVYCFVDESGQHNHGEIFVVAVVIVQKDRAQVSSHLEAIEARSGKKATKWMKSARTRRQAYFKMIFAEPLFFGCCFYSIHLHTQSFHSLTLKTTAAAVQAATANTFYKATVYIDGLQRPEYREVSTALHQSGIVTEKVRGITDESDPLIRLADSVAGLVREAHEGDVLAQELYTLGLARNVLIFLDF